MLNQVLSWKGACVLTAILAILFAINREAHDPTINRPPTPEERRTVKRALTGWGRDFMRQK